MACSKRSNAILLTSHDSSKKTTSYKVLCPALEDVYMWDSRTNQRLKQFKGERSEVTALALSSDQNILAVGYDNGVISLWNVHGQTNLISFK